MGSLGRKGGGAVRIVGSGLCVVWCSESTISNLGLITSMGCIYFGPFGALGLKVSMNYSLNSFKGVT